MSDDFEYDGGDTKGLAFLTRRGIQPALQPLVMTFGIVALLGMGFGAYWVGERFRILRGGHSDSAHVVTAWDHDAPIARDLNGDGVEDVIGVYAGLDPGGIYLGAFNGANGRILWRHGTLNIERPARGGLPQFGIQGDRILINQKGNGTVIGLADGKPVAKLDLPAAREVCMGETPGGPLLVQTQRADNPLEVDLISATVKPLQGRRPCRGGMTTAPITDHSALRGSGAVQFALKDAERVVALATDREKGATLHGYAAGAADPSWSAPVVPSAPATALVPTGVRSADAAAGKAFLGYGVKGGGQHVLGIDAASGKELWRTALEQPPGETVSGLTATGSRVYVAIGERLLVLDAQSGKILRHLGVGRDEE